MMSPRPPERRAPTKGSHLSPAPAPPFLLRSRVRLGGRQSAAKQ